MGHCGIDLLALSLSRFDPNWKWLSRRATSDAEVKPVAVVLVVSLVTYVFHNIDLRFQAPPTIRST